MSDSKLQSDSPFEVFFEGVPVEILAAAALVLEKFVEMNLYRYISYCHLWFKFSIEADWFRESQYHQHSSSYDSYDSVYFDSLDVVLQDGCAGLIIRNQPLIIPDHSFACVDFCDPDFADVVYEKCMEAARVVDWEWVEKRKSGAVGDG